MTSVTRTIDTRTTVLTACLTTLPGAAGEGGGEVEGRRSNGSEEEVVGRREEEGEVVGEKEEEEEDEVVEPERRTEGEIQESEQTGRVAANKRLKQLNGQKRVQRVG